MGCDSSHLFLHRVTLHLSNDHCEVVSTGPVDYSFIVLEKWVYLRQHLSSIIAEAKTPEAAFSPGEELLESVEGHDMLPTKGEMYDLFLFQDGIWCRALDVIVWSRPLVGSFAPDVDSATLHGDS